MNTVSNRVASPSPWRRYAQVVLGLGAVMALAAAFGPVWVVRIGIGIALLAGVLAVVLVWRQVRLERARRGKQAAEAAASHTVSLSTERAQHVAVLSTMESYNHDAADKVRTLKEEIVDLRGQLSRQQMSLAQLRGDKIALEEQVNRLRGELLAREAEVRALSEDDAELLALPRRVATNAALPKAEDIWAEGDYPTVVDLQALALGGEAQTELRQEA